MGRPKSGCLSSFSELVKEKILAIRRSHSGWGPRTIWIELNKDKRLDTVSIPKPSTIAKFLKTHGLVKKYEKHVSLPDSALHKAEYPHHIWQIDGQGAIEVDGIGKVHMLNTKDVFSKVYCGSIPIDAGLHSGSPSGTNYQQALRIAFCEFGMPKTLQTDHASVFFENKGKSPFPTRFHLWLVSLGISLIFSRKATPTDQAIVERAHQTLTNQVIKGNRFESLLKLHEYSDQRRAMLNEVIPCSNIGFGDQSPLTVYPTAKFSGRVYHPNQERALMDIHRVYEFLSKGKWYRKVSKNKTINLGGYSYYIPFVKKKPLVQIHFDSKSKLLIFCDVDQYMLGSMPIKGLSIERLIGSSFYEASIPNFQLRLPRIWEDHLISTTLVNST